MKNCKFWKSGKFWKALQIWKKKFKYWKNENFENNWRLGKCLKIRKKLKFGQKNLEFGKEFEIWKFFEKLGKEHRNLGENLEKFGNWKRFRNLVKLTPLDRRITLAVGSSYWVVCGKNRHNKVFWGTTQHSHCLWPINVWTHSSLPSSSGSYNLEVTIWKFVTLESHNREVMIYKSSSGSVVMCWKSSASSGRVWIWESLVSSGRVWIWESSVSSGRVWIHRCHHLNQQCVDTMLGKTDFIAVSG